MLIGRRKAPTGAAENYSKGRLLAVVLDSETGCIVNAPPRVPGADDGRLADPLLNVDQGTSSEVHATVVVSSVS